MLPAANSFYWMLDQVQHDEYVVFSDFPISPMPEKPKAFQ